MGSSAERMKKEGLKFKEVFCVHVKPLQNIENGWERRDITMKTHWRLREMWMNALPTGSTSFYQRLCCQHCSNENYLAGLQHFVNLNSWFLTAWFLSSSYWNVCDRNCKWRWLQRADGSSIIHSLSGFYNRSKRFV